MYIVTTTLTRPNTSVAFPSNFDAATASYVETAYKATGKLISITSKTSEDRLSKTIVKTFVDSVAHAEWTNDATLAASNEQRLATLHTDGIERVVTIDVA